ncbi:MAG: MFS transporter [Clostridiales bacterium]|jgi:MFS transporter|nr:MFS transporter [Clostridiales bacterium]
MNKLTERRDVNRLIFLCTATYFISYITRINYGAIIAEIAKQTGITNTLLSLALSGQFITYGCGQIISGYFGDRIQPKKLIASGLLVASLMNLLLPFCANAMQMAVVWSINGFAQAFLWPPLMKEMTSLLFAEDCKRATTIVSWGSSLGTIFVYLISPIVISLLNWKYVFFIAAACGIGMTFYLSRNFYEIPAMTKAANKSNGPSRSGRENIKLFFSPVIFLILLAIVLQGALRDGITVWMPSYIAETYHLSSAISILTGVLMPIFSIFCMQLTSLLYRKKIKNPLTCAGSLFFIGFTASLFLAIFTGKSTMLSVVFSALLTGSMHGVNLILICMVPQLFSKTRNVSIISGIFNACTYIGSTLSSYGTPLISDKFSWNATIILWLVIAAVGTILCLLSIRPWKKFQKNLEV